MSILNQTSLNPSDKRHLLLNSLNCQDYGDITNISAEFGVSRKTVYRTRKAGLNILDEHLFAEQSACQISVDEPQIKRTIIAMSIAGVNSIRDIEELLSITYPGITRSFGYIQALQIKAQENAQKFNAQVDLSRIDAIAIDEVFCQNEPILAGIDLDTGFLPILSHEQYRDGQTWGRVLQAGQLQGLSPLHIVKDGAKGMTKAVNDVFPDCEQRDDAFHALYVTNKSILKVERRAYHFIEKEVELEGQIKKAKKSKIDNKDEIADLQQQLKVITGRCIEAIEQYEYAAKGYHILHRALGSVHSCDEIDLMSPEDAQLLLLLSAELLNKGEHSDCNDAARYISNRLKGLTLATAAFYQKQLTLCESYPRELVALACYFFEYKRSLKKISPPRLDSVHTNMLAAYHHIYKTLEPEQADKLMATVEQLLMRRHRASSAIEGFNALLRPYMHVRKGVSQGFLELFKAWYNLRTPRSGKHKGSPAYQLLTGKPVDDWLTMLGFPPSSIIH